MKQTRREFLTAAAGAGLGLAFPGLAAAGERAAGVSTFVTEPSFKVPTLRVLKRSSPSTGALFVTTLTGPGQRGPIIFDDDGQVVWFKKTTNVAINFRRQIYKG
ncbi:MAG: hypothetical protein ACTHKS_11280, partial [Gaiellaceae bacterium]